MSASKRNPIISFLLSILTPGLGQIYNSQIRKGLAIYLLLVFLEFAVLPVFGIALTFSGMLIFTFLIFAIFFYAVVDSIKISKKKSNNPNRKMADHINCNSQHRILPNI